MLDIKNRIKLIDSLVAKNTDESLTYAALECRLTLEYLCYERFKLRLSYLSESDLKSWQPKHIVKQISDEIDENISNKISIGISVKNINSCQPKNQKEFESLDYVPLGFQSEIKIKKIHSLWQAISGVALHIPVPSILASDISIYGNKDKIREKVSDVVSMLSEITGNLLIGCDFGEEYSFNCLACDTKIKRPVINLKEATVVSCINPKCQESYRIEKDSDGELEVTRRIIWFTCYNCNEYLEVPMRIFRGLNFEEVLKIQCASCDIHLNLIMYPRIKKDVSE